VPTKLISLNQFVPSRLYDNKMATEIVVQLLDHKNQLSFISNSQINNDVSSIIDLIDREVFHIKLQNGKSQRNEDLKILTDLRSNNINKKSIAMLKIIYNVRCNIFHGSKDFQEYQRQLIEPLTNILTIVISDLYNELTN